MILVESSWQDSKTFKLVPIAEECPYVEGIYDPITDVFVLISKVKKVTMHMLPKLNDFGDVEFLKTGKRPNGKVFKEERKPVETFQEYYIEDFNAIEYIINKFAENNTFDWKKYITPTEAIKPTEPKQSLIV